MNIEKSNKTYSKEKQLILDYLDEDVWKATPTIAENTEPESMSWTYWRNKLVPALLHKLLDEEKIQQEKRPEGGEFTHYWRLE